MRKAWVYQRKNRPGWYVGWYDSAGKKRSKRCPNKSLADRFARRIEHQYNEDLYPDPVATPWDELVNEYLIYKETVKNLADDSLRSIRTTLTQFKERPEHVHVKKCYYMILYVPYSSLPHINTSLSEFSERY